MGTLLTLVFLKWKTGKKDTAVTGIPKCSDSSWPSPGHWVKLAVNSRILTLLFAFTTGTCTAT